jgi:hypothetical protein
MFSAMQEHVAPGSSDADLVIRAREGDRDAFAAIYDRYGDRLHDFCWSILRVLLERHTDAMLELARRWNADPDPWLRRASVVLFTRKAGESGRFTDVALELCNNLAHDDHDMVRKGVGWALKDVMRADRQRVIEYVKSLRAAGVSSVITLYAVRDLDGPDRQAVLDVKPHQ